MCSRGMFVIIGMFIAVFLAGKWVLFTLFHDKQTALFPLGKNPGLFALTFQVFSCHGALQEVGFVGFDGQVDASVLLRGIGQGFAEDVCQVGGQGGGGWSHLTPSFYREFPAKGGFFP